MSNDQKLICLAPRKFYAFFMIYQYRNILYFMDLRNIKQILIHSDDKGIKNFVFIAINYWYLRFVFYCVVMAMNHRNLFTPA